MSTYRADAALLPAGWREDVRLEVDDRGFLRSVVPGDGPGGSPGDLRPGGDPSAAGAVERIRGAVVPGVPNLHSHAFQRGMSGLAERAAEDGGFWSWRETMYRFAGRLDPEEVEAIAAQLYVEMLLAGYTSVAEFHYLHRDRDGVLYEDPAEISRRLLRAARTAGIGLTLLPCLYTSGGFGGAPPEEAQRRFLLPVDGLLELVDRLGDAVDGDPRLRLGLALHSLRAVTPPEIEEAVAAVLDVDPDAPIHVHAAEQQREVEACLAWSGARPVAWLLDHAPVDGSWCLVHATHVDEREVRGLAGSGAVAGLCPSTEANLGDGLFPLADFLEAGGHLGVGSDSHVSVSPVEELRWLEYGQRLAGGRRNVAAGQGTSTGARLFGSAVEGGAAALGQPVGELREGARADWVVLEREHPALVGRSGDALLDGWIFSGNRSPVRDVVVAGRWRVRDGRHPEEEAIADRYREAARRLAEDRGRG